MTFWQHCEYSYGIVAYEVCQDGYTGRWGVLQQSLGGPLGHLYVAAMTFVVGYRRTHEL